MRRTHVVLLGLAGLLICSSTASAQLCICPPDDPAVSRIQVARDGARTVLTGRIIDLETLRGVVTAQVGSEQAGALSDSTGAFRIQVPSSRDTLRLRIERIGYLAVNLAVPPDATELAFIFRSVELDLCGLMVGSFPPPGIHFVPLDKSTQRIIERDASLTVFHWESGNTSTLRVEQGSTSLGLVPGVYDITAEVRGYEPWFARRFVVELEPCNSSRIQHRTISAWFDPLP